MRLQEQQLIKLAMYERELESNLFDSTFKLYRQKRKIRRVLMDEKQEQLIMSLESKIKDKEKKAEGLRKKIGQTKENLGSVLREIESLENKKNAIIVKALKDGGISFDGDFIKKILKDAGKIEATKPGVSPPTPGGETAKISNMAETTSHENSENVDNGAEQNEAALNEALFGKH